MVSKFTSDDSRHQAQYKTSLSARARFESSASGVINCSDYLVKNAVLATRRRAATLQHDAARGDDRGLRFRYIFL